MNPQEASALLAFARQHDHLVLNTDAEAQTWAYALGPRDRANGTRDEGVPFEAGRLLVQDYYGMHLDPQNRKPLDASIIRKLYTSKKAELGSKHRAIAPPPPKTKPGMPRWYVIEQQAKGRRPDLDPMDFEDRPRPRRHDPTRERHP